MNNLEQRHENKLIETGNLRHHGYGEVIAGDIFTISGYAYRILNYNRLAKIDFEEGYDSKLYENRFSLKAKTAPILTGESRNITSAA